MKNYTALCKLLLFKFLFVFIFQWRGDFPIITTEATLSCIPLLIVFGQRCMSQEITLHVVTYYTGSTHVRNYFSVSALFRMHHIFFNSLVKSSGCYDKWISETKVNKCEVLFINLLISMAYKNMKKSVGQRKGSFLCSFSLDCQSPKCFSGNQRTCKSCFFLKNQQSSWIFFFV